MPDLDLGPAIEAAAKAFWESGTHPVPWDQLEPASREPYLIDMRAAIEGALPELRKAIAEELSAWADEGHDGSIVGPKAARRRHIKSAARHVAGPMSMAEVAQAIRDGNVIVCREGDIHPVRGQGGGGQ